MNPAPGEPQTARGQVLSLIRDEGPMSRAELARRLALSATTITRVVNDLDAAEVLDEVQALAQATERLGSRLKDLNVRELETIDVPQAQFQRGVENG